VNVFDSSALLAFLQAEPGSDLVEHAMVEGGVCGAANWSEVAQKVRQRAGDWDLASGLLLDFGLTVEPVGMADAERAAELWMGGTQLSLGDRLCLALGERIGATVWTADAAWGASASIRQIR
jgi:PIN domain nuclease of toxin-antitoxin system